MLNTPFKRIRTAGRVQGAGRSLSMRRVWYADPPQAGDGGEKADGEASKEADPPGADDLEKLTPAELAKMLRETRRENGAWRTKLREQEQADAAAKAQAAKAEQERQAAEAKKLAEQGDFKTLYEKQQAEMQALRDAAKRAESFEQKLKARNEARIKAIPETHRKMIPVNYSPEQLEEWLDASEELLKKPAAPNLDNGKKGEKKITPDPARTLRPLKF